MQSVEHIYDSYFFFFCNELNNGLNQNSDIYCMILIVRFNREGQDQ